MQRGADEDLSRPARTPGHQGRHDKSAGALIVATDGTHAHDVAGQAATLSETDGTGGGAEDLARTGVAAAVQCHRSSGRGRRALAVLRSCRAGGLARRGRRRRRGFQRPASATYGQGVTVGVEDAVPGRASPPKGSTISSPMEMMSGARSRVNEHVVTAMTRAPFGARRYAYRRAARSRPRRPRRRRMFSPLAGAARQPGRPWSNSGKPRPRHPWAWARRTRYGSQCRARGRRGRRPRRQISSVAEASPASQGCSLTVAHAPRRTRSHADRSAMEG